MIVLPFVWAIWAVLIGLGWWLFAAAGFVSDMPTIVGVVALSFATTVAVFVIGTWVRALSR